MLDDLSSEGILCRVNDELYFSHPTVNELRDRIVHHLRQQGRVDMQGFKSLTGMTRKFLVPVLEYLDETGVTHRVDDTTRVLRARLRTGEGHQAAIGENGSNATAHC